jgi:predicted Zn-dependent protease
MFLPIFEGNRPEQQIQRWSTKHREDPLDQALAVASPEMGSDEAIPAPWMARRHWRRLGRAMHRSDLDRAEKLAIAYLRKHPQDTTSWEVWGEVLRARKQHMDEERILRRGVDFTGAPRLRFRLAQILASSGHADEARAVLDAFTMGQLRLVVPGSGQLALVPVQS